MIPKIPFGKTGHDSTRTIFGAAALGGMRQSKADQVMEMLLEFGVNHIDTAASYGDSELRLAPWLREHRETFFLATKTGDRTFDKARDSLHRSLERLGVDHVDLIQMHNLSNERDWQVAMNEGGALEALVAAREEGLVRHIGVTGHGTYVAAMHLKSLAAYDFASVLAPYNFAMMQSEPYATEFNSLYDYCQANRIAIQTIKSIARRRWRDSDDDPHFSWYMPIRDDAALERAVRYVLSRDGLFLNTSSDTTLLKRVLEIASAPIERPTDVELRSDVDAQGLEPLFVRDVSDNV